MEIPVHTSQGAEPGEEVHGLEPPVEPSHERALGLASPLPRLAKGAQVHEVGNDDTTGVEPEVLCRH